VKQVKQVLAEGQDEKKQEVADMMEDGAGEGDEGMGAGKGTQDRAGGAR
jgi:hypothetical protein